MNPFKTLIVCIALVSVAPTSFANDSELQLGSELFDEFCSGCHGANADGLSQFSDTLETFNERLEGITENMPDFAGVFEEDEITALFTYIDQTTSGE